MKASVLLTLTAESWRKSVMIMFRKALAFSRKVALLKPSGKLRWRALQVQLGDTIQWTVGPRFLAGKSPLLLLWDEKSLRAPKATELVQATSREFGHKARIIEIINPERIVISDMYELIHRGRPDLHKGWFSKKAKIVFCIDPISPLPVLLRVASPNTYLVMYLSEPARLDRNLLDEVDCLIYDQELEGNLASAGGPLRYPTSSNEEVFSRLKNFQQIVNATDTNLFFAIKTASSSGDDFVDLAHFRDTDLVFVGCSIENLTVTAEKCFENYVADLCASSPQIFIHSRWLYRLETLLVHEELEKTCLWILSHGGVVSFAGDVS